MTIRDLLDQVELQGKIKVQEVTDCGVDEHYCGCSRDLSKKVNFLDREITYIFPTIVIDRPGICIEIK